jgi:hypothetical protein
MKCIDHGAREPIIVWDSVLVGPNTFCRRLTMAFDCYKDRIGLIGKRDDLVRFGLPDLGSSPRVRGTPVALRLWRPVKKN